MAVEAKPVQQVLVEKCRKQVTTVLGYPVLLPRFLYIRQALSPLELLWFLEFFLELAYSRLPDPPDAEAMGTGDIPESLTFSLRGSIECARTDHVDPLDTLLRKAIAETPASLIRDWQKRQRKGR